MNHPMDFIEEAMSRRAIVDAVDIVMGHRGTIEGFRHAIREAVKIDRNRSGAVACGDYEYAVKVAATIADLGKLDSADVSRIMKEEKSR
jgi:hypothetical protein